MSKKEKIHIIVSSGVEGSSLYINDIRVCGPKPWGGGRVLHEWTTTKDEVLGALPIPEMKALDETMITDKMIAELKAERNRQIEKGYTDESDDLGKEVYDWIEDIRGYVAWAEQMDRMDRMVKYRHRMMQVAVLAIAACQSYDRQNGEDNDRI